MAIDPKFKSLIDRLAPSIQIEGQRRAAEGTERIQAIAEASEAFRPTEDFLGDLADALKEGLDQSFNLSTDGEWIASSGLDSIFCCYILSMNFRGSKELWFYITEGATRVELEKQTFLLTERASIESALQTIVARFVEK